MAVVDLSSREWVLTGWRPLYWKMAGNSRILPDAGPVPAKAPGSVHAALLRAGILSDPFKGVASRDCEWVDHRHWEFSTVIPAGALPRQEKILLDAEGLDYSGWIVVDGKEVGEFRGALKPHCFDLTQYMGDGKEHTLSIIFDQAPHEQGQIGWTSRTRLFKTRYNYGWDWCPRMVAVGIYGALRLKTGLDAAIADCRVAARLAADFRTGSVEVGLELARSAALGAGRRTLVATVSDGVREIGRASVEVKPGNTSLRLSDLPVSPWRPNGEGEQKLYDLRLSIVDESQRALWTDRRRIGFKHVSWRQCAGAPQGAAPYLCVMNGKPIFLQGVNWTPIRPYYMDANREDYRSLLRQYRDMGCNLLRVWGGAFLESSDFYDLCDELGLLVWQEFPLSSSGFDDKPPEDPEVIRELVEIARTYIRRRRHHASLLLWCGGNELSDVLERDGLAWRQPSDATHACLAPLAALVEAEDPGRRFLPTSPSGLRSHALEENIGKGLHHDVHGPWDLSWFGNEMGRWSAYWKNDDALFRSEVGFPSAEDAETIRAYAGALPAWPPDGPYWMHSMAWYHDTTCKRLWNRIENLPPEEQLDRFVAITQDEQAKGLAAAAEACKSRFPRCAGFLVWMGHDAFPCPVNTSIIDFDKRPKPAYFALQEIFRRPPTNRVGE